MKIIVINGPNINMLGIRETNVYGNKTYSDLCMLIEKYCETKKIEVDFYQSNHEGNLVDKIQQAYFNKVEGIVINPGAYTHTSVALLDALKSTNIKTVEVHISKIDERESFRQISYIRGYCAKCITGEGFDGYLHAIDYLYECKDN